MGGQSQTTNSSQNSAQNAYAQNNYGSNTGSSFGQNSGQSSAQTYDPSQLGKAYLATGTNAANTAGNISTFMNPYTNSVADATMARLGQLFGQQQSQLQGNAASAGALGGSRQAVEQAVLAGQQGLAAGSTLSNLYNTGYQQALQAAMANAAQNIQAAGLSGGTTAGQNLSSTLGQQQSSTLGGANTAQASSGTQSGTSKTTTDPGLMGYLSAGAGILGALSDERVKEDSEPIGKTFDGQTIYKFRYKGHPETHIGLMAQEVEKHHPEAVGDIGGLKTVDYDAATKDAERRGYEGGGGVVADFLSGTSKLSGVPGLSRILNAARMMMEPSQSPAQQQPAQQTPYNSIMQSYNMGKQAAGGLSNLSNMLSGSSSAPATSAGGWNTGTQTSGLLGSGGLGNTVSGAAGNIGTAFSGMFAGSPGAAPSSTPSLSMPNISMPNISMPNISMPSLSAPSIRAPSIAMPTFGGPGGVSAPLPSVPMPRTAGGKGSGGAVRGYADGGDVDYGDGSGDVDYGADAPLFNGAPPSQAGLAAPAQVSDLSSISSNPANTYSSGSASPHPAVPAYASSLPPAVYADPNSMMSPQDAGLASLTRQSPQVPLGTPSGSAHVVRDVISELRAAGMSDNGIRGVLANVRDESGFDPSLRHPDQPKWGGEAHYAHGLFQQGGDEWNRYEAWLRQNAPGADWRDHRLQARFLAQNLKDNYPDVWKGINSATPEEAAKLFTTGYLKPASQYAQSRVANYGLGIPGLDEFVNGAVGGVRSVASGVTGGLGSIKDTIAKGFDNSGSMPQHPPADQKDAHNAGLLGRMFGGMNPFNLNRNERTQLVAASAILAGLSKGDTLGGINSAAGIMQNQHVTDRQSALDAMRIQQQAAQIQLEKAKLLQPMPGAEVFDPNTYQWIKQYKSYNPATGKWEFDASGQGAAPQPAMAPPGVAPGTIVTGSGDVIPVPEALRDKINLNNPTDVQAAAVISGREPMPAISRANPRAQIVQNRVRELDPSFSSNRFKYLQDWEKGNGKIGQNRTSFNAAMEHGEGIYDLNEANGYTANAGPLSHAITIGKKWWDSASNEPWLNDYNAAAKEFANEAAKLGAGSTGSALTDREEILSTLDPSRGKEAVRAAIQRWVSIMDGKGNALVSDWKQRMGPYGGSAQVLSEENKARHDKIMGVPQEKKEEAGAIPVLTPEQARNYPSGKKYRTTDGRLMVR